MIKSADYFSLLSKLMSEDKSYNVELDMDIEEMYNNIYPESIDIDCIGYNIDLSNIPTDVEVYLHYPLVLSTYGHICELASVSKEISKKFRPDDICNYECFACKMRFSNDDMVYFKVRRGIYYPLPSEQNIHISGHRIKIIHKAKEFCYEDFSSAQRV